MEQIIIARKYISPKPRWLYNPETQMFDYMGMILQQLKYPVILKRSDKVQFPDELGIPIPPFTRYCRNKLMLTDLAISIMNLKPTEPGTEMRLAELLKDHYKVVFVDG